MGSGMLLLGVVLSLACYFYRYLPHMEGEHGDSLASISTDRRLARRPGKRGRQQVRTTDDTDPRHPLQQEEQHDDDSGGGDEGMAHRLVTRLHWVVS